MNAKLDHRIIVFGREGLAREQLVIALSENGAEPIWVGSPNQCDTGMLVALNPNQIVVSMEPSIESDLEPLNEYINQHSIDVLYDDAESTQFLSGWQLNRWARHLASKLLNIDYMPPSPMGVVKNQEQYSDNLAIDELHTKNKLKHSTMQWSDAKASNEQILQFASSVDDNDEFELDDLVEYDSVSIDSIDLHAELVKLNDSLSNSSDGIDSFEYEFGNISVNNEFEIVGNEATSEYDELSFGNGFSIKNDNAENSNLQSLSLSEKPDSELDDPLEFMNETQLQLAIANLEIQIAAAAPIASAKLDLELIPNEDISNFPVNGKNEFPQNREFDTSKFSLVNDNAENTDADLEHENSSNSSARNMFLVISGVGGPGIVRSILGNIKSNFSGILVLSQSIEASQLPKFMVQLQKATSTPVAMPESDEYLMTGHIYLLPENHTIQLTALGYQCVTHKSLADFLEQMDQNLEIVVLSGADVALTQTLIQINQLLNNVHIQEPEECIDATLPQLLANIGAQPINNEIFETWFN